MSPIRLLVVSQYWSPAQRAGGARSTERAVASLGDDVVTFVLAGDRDVGDDEPWPAAPAGPLPAPSRWVERSGVAVRHQPWDRRAGRRVAATIADLRPDVVYLPSLFAPGSRAVLWRRAVGLLRIPVVVAPEGELDAGALAHHRGRKRAAVALARVAGLGRRLRWRAADEREAADLRAALGRRARVAIAPDLPGPPADPGPPPAGRPPKVPGRVRVVFLGTIVEKKGLATALEVLWPHRHEVELDVVGPVGDPAEAARSRAWLDRAGPGVAWRWRGPIAHDEVAALLGAADLLILPTKGENYGYTILEALDAGAAVLVSDRTPWQDLDASGCGWVVPLEDLDRWRDRIGEAIGWDERDRARVRLAARARAARARAEAEAAAGAWRDLVVGAASGAG